MRALVYHHLSDGALCAPASVTLRDGRFLCWRHELPVGHTISPPASAAADSALSLNASPEPAAPPSAAERVWVSVPLDLLGRVLALVPSDAPARAELRAELGELLPGSDC